MKHRNLPTPFITILNSLALLAAVGWNSSQAATNNWVFTTGTPRWSVAANWSGGVPTAGDDAFIGNGTTAGVEGLSVATAANLFIDHGGVTVGSIDPGALTVDGEIAIGTVGNTGSLTLNTGTITLNQLSLGANGTYSDTTLGTLILAGSVPIIQVASGLNLIVNSQVAGSNGLTKAGLGTVTLLNSNLYTGGTTINAGTLQIGNNSATGSLGEGDVTNNATLVFRRNNELIVSNLITGTGALRQIGTGRLILTGDNNYSGGTTITSGSLQVGDGGTTGTVGTGNVTNNTSLIFNRGDTLVVTNIISGTGSLTQAGGGTLVLAGSNTYSGVTLISTGTVQVGDGGTSGNLGTGNVTDQSALVFNRSDDVVVANLITGTGTVAQAGSGTLILTADNTFSGGTFINAGTLQVGNAGTTGGLGTGNITNNAALVFNRTNDLEVANLISGTGSLTHSGAGALTLTGSNTFSGGTWLQGGGVLDVKNTFALGTGDVNIVNGTLKSDPMVINVGGNYVQGTDGTLQLTIGGTATGEFDQLNVAGAISLAGTVQVVQANGYVPHHNDAVALMIAAGGITGAFEFTNTMTVSALLTESLDLVGGTVAVLSWTQQSFVPFAETPNQASVAQALDSIANATNASAVALINYLDYLPIPGGLGQMPYALDLIAPEELSVMSMLSHAGMDAAGYRFLNRAGYLRAGYRALYADLYELGQSPSDEDLSAYINNPWGIYVEGIGENVDVNSTANADGHKQTSYGFVIGADRRLNDQLVVGLAASYATSDADVIFGGSIKTDDIVGHLYALWFSKGFHVEALAGGGTRSYDTRRQALGGLAVGSTDATEWTGLLGAGYDWEKNGWRFGPQATLQYMSTSIDAFTETGSLAPLRIESQSVDAFHTQLGGHLGYRFYLQGTETFLTTEAYAAWRHDFSGAGVAVDSQFADGTGNIFTVRGPELGRESLVTGLGVNVQWNPVVNTYISYTTQLWRTGYSGHDAAIGVRVCF